MIMTWKNVPMNRTITKEKYRFGEDGHRHELLKDGEWKPLIGVTTALSVIAKPALIQWSANMAVDYIQKALAEPQVVADKMGLQSIDLDTLFKEARVAHRIKKEKAGEAGTDVHFEVEQLLKGIIGAWGGMVEAGTKSDKPQIQKFLDWAIENKIKFLESERHVFSEKLWIGGILDMVIELDGKRLIADIKTSSGIYNEAFFQMAAYDLCLEEMGEKIDGYLVINLKKTGEFDLKMAEDREVNREAFLSALSLYKVIQRLK